jgi:hypothetical protein
MADATPDPSERTFSEALFGDAPLPLRERKLAAELAGALRDCATALLDEQKTRTANEIATLGEVLHRSVQSLDRGGGEHIARYAADAARRISQFADRLRCRSLEELSRDIEGFAQRRPTVFLTLAVSVGLTAGRVLASSASRPAEHHLDRQRASQSSVNTGDERPGDTWCDDPVVDAVASASANPGAAGSARDSGR